MDRLLVIACLIASVVTASDARLSKMEYKDANGKSLLYQAHIPTSVLPNKKIPLVLFLHGAGERGSDNERQSIHGVPQILDHLQKHDQQAIVLAPQCPKGKKWVNTPWGAKSHTMPKAASESMELALALVAESLAKYPIDLNRVYITGLSMGGYGTWDAIQRKPTLFAAAAPICGGADAALAATIAHIPIWTWHGDKDGVVPVNRSRDVIAALKAAGGNPKYTELAGVGHNAWTPAFKSTELLAWLLAQRKK